MPTKDDDHSECTASESVTNRNHYVLGEVEPMEVFGDAMGPFSHIDIQDRHFKERVFHVSYWPQSIQVNLHAEGDGQIRMGMLADLSPSQARDLAAKLNEAADCLEDEFGEIEREGCE